MKNKFGLEIEINSFDNRDFLNSPLRKGELPEGIHDIVKIINGLGLQAECQSWGYNHNNVNWICKPDSSCGIEICSPVFNYDEIKEIIAVIDALSVDERIKIDNRCSLHVHADIDSLVNFYDSNLICSILAWWIKCEHVFVDFAAPNRKTNRYCKFIGQMQLFDHDEAVSTFRAVSKLSDKYLTLNTFHMFNKRRWTVEFRLAESTKDSNFVKNWLSIINCFLESAKSKSVPDNYKWMSHFEVFEFLNLDAQLQNWFLKRLLINCEKDTPMGTLSYESYLKILDKNSCKLSEQNHK